jgi:hypothetical protein
MPRGKDQAGVSKIATIQSAPAPQIGEAGSRDPDVMIEAANKSDLRSALAA